MRTTSKGERVPLLKEGFKPDVVNYPVKSPAIKSGEAYYFETDSGLRYQVLFARKKSSYLEHIVNFSVLNEEFEDEYSETNRGEIYHVNHPHSTSYEFSGEFKKGNEHREVSIRTMLYFREAGKIMHPAWNIKKEGNKVIVSRKTG